WAPIAVSGIDAIGLHHAALAWPSAAVLPLALAGALAFARSKALRHASAPLAAAGFVALLLGSTSFIHRFGNDPFLTASGPLAVTVTTVDRSRAEFRVPFEVSALRLSPAGDFVALSSEDEDEETTVHAGRAGGPLAAFTGDEAVFVDEGRLLLFAQQPGASVLRVVDLTRENREVWSLRVRMSAARLLFDGASNGWRPLRWNPDGDIASAAGTIGDSGVREE